MKRDMRQVDDQETSVEAYSAKVSGYFDVKRRDLYELFPRSYATRVLEIGSGEGSLLVALKQAGKAKEVVGVELMKTPGNGQSRPEIDRFIFADVERQELDLDANSFDVLICGDVLEHLRDPWATFRYLTTFLKEDGAVLVSLPNILYWRALGRILLGDFRYAPSGVLDETHLRFFCKKNMISLVEAVGFRVTTIEPSFLRQIELKADRLRNTLSLGLLERHLAQQYLIVAERTSH